MAQADRLAFGRELRRLRQRAGVSLGRLAELVHYSKSYLSKVENGVKPATRDLAVRCDEALDASGSLAGLCAERSRTRAGNERVRGAGEDRAVGGIVPRQLPAPTRHFTGRDRELALLDRIFEGDGENVVIAALCGTGGIGKTALAVHWAHRAAGRYDAGQLFVNLRGFDPTGAPVSPAEALRGFLEAFNVPCAQVPLGMDARGALYRSITATKRLLVVLDNAGDAEQVRPLLPAGPGCAVLITSRDPLAGLVASEGVRLIALELLDVAAARKLLIARLGTERVQGEERAADELLRLCAGLPLAINIAAARAVTQQALSLAGQVEQMRTIRTRLDALSTGDRATDVRAVFSWSHRLLSPAAARLFRLLGLHPGATFAQPAVASLFGVSRGDVRELLAELVRAHLLMQQGDGRYALHDLLRAYAVELLAAAADDDESERDGALVRLLDHYVYSAQTAARLLNPQASTPGEGGCGAGVMPEDFATYDEAMAWFEAEHTCLSAVVTEAAEAGHEDYAWKLSSALTTFLDRRSLWTELASIQRVALAAARRREDARGEAGALRGLGRACMRLREYEDSYKCLEQVLDIYDRLGDELGLAHVNHDLALVCEQQGRQAEALKHAVRALELFEAAGSRNTQANALNTVGWFYAMNGEYAAALHHCRKALDLYCELGRDSEEIAGTLDSLGYVHHCLGEYAQAATAYQRAIDLYRKAGDRYYEAGTLVRLGDTHCAAHDTAAAHKARWRALAILKELRHPDAQRVLAILDSAERDGEAPESE